MPDSWLMSNGFTFTQAGRPRSAPCSSARGSAQPRNTGEAKLSPLASRSRPDLLANADPTKSFGRLLLCLELMTGLKQGCQASRISLGIHH